MKRMASFLFAVILQCSVLQPSMAAKTKQAAAQGQLPSTPKAFQATSGEDDLSTLWPLVIDGKDASEGPTAYSASGFDKVLNDGLPFVLGDNRTPSRAVLSEIHDHCCDGFAMRSTMAMVPMEDYMPACFRSMACAARKEAIEGVPEELRVITWDKRKGNDGCPKEIHTRPFSSSGEVQQELDKLTAQYLKSLKDLAINDPASLQKPLTQDHPTLQVLVTFLRSVAWLHPFQDGNGRFRTLLLQHEIRRLGLGPGAYMYNNNRDIFFESSSTYAAKIVEGVTLAKQNWKSEVNPWVDSTVVQRHMDRFQASGQCHDGGEWGSIKFSATRSSGHANRDSV